MTDAGTGLAATIGAVSKALSTTTKPFMIIGGIAVIARGVPRHTDDVDATIQAEGLDLENLLAALADEGIVPRIPDALEFARRRQVLLLRHEPSDTEIEVSLAWLPFEIEALDRAEVVDFGDAQAPVARAEDLLVYKSVAFRERDRADIERLLELHANEINLRRVPTLPTRCRRHPDRRKYPRPTTACGTRPASGRRPWCTAYRG